MRVIIVVTLNGTPQVLMDGVMTHHQIAPGSEPGHSTLTVTGKDLTARDGLIDFSGIPYPGHAAGGARRADPAQVRASSASSRMVIPSVCRRIADPDRAHSRASRARTCSYIKQLAEEVGYVFYIDPGPVPGMNVAYWGPEIKVGVPQPALNINMDAHTNVESLSFSFDNETKELPIVLIQNQATKVPIPIPIPDITPLNPPLGLIPPMPPKINDARRHGQATRRCRRR